MRQPWIIALLGFSLILPAMGGCDKTQSEDKTVTKNPQTGAETKKETKVSTTQGGGTKTETETKTVNP